MSVAIMRFRAGSTGYAVAAGCVASVRPAQQGVPHLAHVLDAGESPQLDGARTLQVVANGRGIDVTVDGPVDVVEVAEEQITPCPATLRSNVLGFARFADAMYALLDAEVLVAHVASKLMMNPATANPVSLP